MKIQKGKLLQIVKESQIEMDEMAKHANPKSRPLFDEDGNLVGHRMRVNIDDPESASFNVLFACQEDIGQFIDSHQELIQRIKEKEFNDEDERLQKELIFTNVSCPAYRPHQRRWADDEQKIPRRFYDINGNEIDITTKRYQVSGEQLTLQEAINRKLKEVLFKELMMDKDLESHLTDCSIPFFKVRERRYEDRHNIKNTNQKINYGSDVFNLYESTNDFLKDVLNKSVGLESDVEKRETHLARLRNKLYRNWEPTKKNQKKYYGLTPKYYLEASGFAEKNYDVNIMSKFDLTGLLFDTAFIWMFKFKVTYGKKISVEQLIKNENVKTFKDIVTRKEIELVQNLGIDENDSKKNILTSPEVLNGLYEGLNELKSELMRISTDDALEMANYFQYEVGGMEEMNESFDKMIKRVLKESGFKHKVRIKESDLIKMLTESVVKTIVEQEQFDDFITKAKANYDDMADDRETNKDMENDVTRDQDDGQGNDESMKDQVELTLATDDTGKFYILKNGNSNNPQIIATTN